MLKALLYFSLMFAFVGVAMVAGYLLLVAGAKYNGDSLSPLAVYQRAIYGEPKPVVEPRNIDSGIKPKSELEILHDSLVNGQQASPTPAASPISGQTGSGGQTPSGTILSTPSPVVSSGTNNPDGVTAEDYQRLYKILSENNIKLGQ